MTDGEIWEDMKFHEWPIALNREDRRRFLVERCNEDVSCLFSYFPSIDPVLNFGFMIAKSCHTRNYPSKFWMEENADNYLWYASFEDGYLPSGEVLSGGKTMFPMSTFVMLSILSYVILVHYFLHRRYSFSCPLPDTSLDGLIPIYIRPGSHRLYGRVLAYFKSELVEVWPSAGRVDKSV